MSMSRNKNLTQRCAPKDVPQGTSGQKHICTEWSTVRIWLSIGKAEMVEYRLFSFVQ